MRKKELCYNKDMKDYDFKVVSWDWKERMPAKRIAELQDQFAYETPVDLGNDCYNMVFTHFQPTDREAEMLVEEWINE